MLKIADSTKALDKASQQLAQEYEALQKANASLIKQKVEYQAELKKVNQEVKDAKKAFNELADEANSDAYTKALEKQAELRSQINGTTKALQANQQQYKKNIEEIQKSATDSKTGTILGLAKGLAVSQVGSQLASSIGGGIQTLAASSIGMPTASALSDTLSGAIAGGTAGVALGPMGVIGGALAGAASGGIASWTKISEAKDDSFKDYYKTLYDDANARTEESISSGSTLAGSREKDRISFSTLFGSEEKADDYLKSMVSMANTTPFLYDDLKDMSKTLATYGWDDSNMLPVLQQIGDAGAALGMATSDMSAVATALGRMKSSDKATLEYLNILNDRGIGAVGYLAEARGVSVGDMYSQISKGEISGNEAVDILLEALERDFSGSMLEQSKTFEGLSSTLEGLMQEIDNAGGEGYNTLRKEGMQEDIDAYGGRLGETLQYLSGVEGQTRAMMENLQAQYQREALSAVTMGTRHADMSLFSEEEKAELAEMANEFRFARIAWDQSMEETGEGNLEAGAKMEALREQAESLAQAAFDSSEDSKTLQEVTLDQIDATRESIAAMADLSGALRSYNEEQAFTKGMGAQALAGLNTGKDAPESVMSLWKDFQTNGTTEGFAVGLDRVPYDNFPAILHEGERVLTAQQAREMDGEGSSEGGIQINITGNSFMGTNDEIVDQITDAMVQRLQLARMRG
ncbi:MAG: tape measure protein [Ruminococcus flavefaciens]|nr:tape measure protein [Ruminococcus flavefaciens]